MISTLNKTVSASFSYSWPSMVENTLRPKPRNTTQNLKCLLFQLGMGKKIKKFGRKKVFQRRRKSSKRKIEHFQSIKFFIFFYPSPALSSLLFSFLTRISEEQGMQSSLMCSAKKLLHCCTHRWKGEKWQTKPNRRLFAAFFWINVLAYTRAW